MKLAQVVRNFIPTEVAEQNAVLLDDISQIVKGDNDPQCPSSESYYCLHTDLLEDCVEKMEEITGLELEPAYSYCRICPKGEVLKRHHDREACQVSATVNLRNKGGAWPFHWEGGSFAMQPGDAVVYRGCDVDHWRDSNPAEEVHQVFLHYVDVNGPYSDQAYEYLRVKPFHVHRLLGTEIIKK